MLWDVLEVDEAMKVDDHQVHALDHDECHDEVLDKVKEEEDGQHLHEELELDGSDDDYVEA